MVMWCSILPRFNTTGPNPTEASPGWASSFGPIASLMKATFDNRSFRRHSRNGGDRDERATKAAIYSPKRFPSCVGTALLWVDKWRLPAIDNMASCGLRNDGVTPREGPSSPRTQRKKGCVKLRNSYANNIPPPPSHPTPIHCKPWTINYWMIIGLIYLSSFDHKMKILIVSISSRPVSVPFACSSLRHPIADDRLLPRPAGKGMPGIPFADRSGARLLCSPARPDEEGRFSEI